MRLAPAAAAAALALVAAPAAARAETPAPARSRAPTIGVLAGFALVDLGEADPYSGGEPRALGFLGASLAWDTPPPAYPAAPGYAVKGDVVPEIQLMQLGDGGLVLGGVRVELDIAQKEQGLLRLSARSSIWVAARAGVGDLAEGLIGAVELGSTIYAGSAWRFGYAVGALMWREDEAAEPLPVDGGVIYNHAEAPLDAALTLGIFVASTI